MSQAELEIGRTVIRTVKFDVPYDEVKEIVVAHLKRKYSAKLRDFELSAVLDSASGIIVSGEARTDGLAPTRKRKARP